jgi:hypothetical protein
MSHSWNSDRNSGISANKSSEAVLKTFHLPNEMELVSRKLVIEESGHGTISTEKIFSQKAPSKSGEFSSGIHSSRLSDQRRDGSALE